MKSESFTSCRGWVNISGGSKIAQIDVECNGDSLLLPFLWKLKSVGRPAQLLLFLRDKLVVRRQLKRFRKNRNCSLGQESIHLAAVTLTANGCVNNIKFPSYLIGNQPLTCKLNTKRQLPSYTSYFSCHTLKGVNTGFTKKFSDQDSRFTIQHSRLVNLLLLKKVDLLHNWVYNSNAV